MFGKPLLSFEVLESTNKTAADLLSRGEVSHGAVILAKEQSDGRGQRGSAWRAAPGLDLTFTIVAQPKALRADAQFVLGKIAALAVSDVVRSHVPDAVRIKWPNDVLIERRKVAGILIKNDLVGELVMNSLIGIGFNVNSREHDPDHVATSLALETGKTFNRMAVLDELLERFGHWWQKWDAARDSGLVSYSDRLWTRGRWAEMHLDGQPISARPMDVDELGRLIVEMEDGQVAAYGLDRLRFAKR